MTELSEIYKQLYTLDHSIARIAHLAPYEEQVGDKKMFKVIAISNPTSSYNLANLEKKMHIEIFYDGHLYYICKKRKWINVTPCPPTQHSIIIGLIDKSKHYERMSKKITKICEKEI